VTNIHNYIFMIGRVTLLLRCELETLRCLCSVLHTYTHTLITGVGYQSEWGFEDLKSKCLLLHFYDNHRVKSSLSLKTLISQGQE